MSCDNRNVSVTAGQGMFQLFYLLKGQSWPWASCHMGKFKDLKLQPTVCLDFFPSSVLPFIFWLLSANLYIKRYIFSSNTPTAWTDITFFPLVLIPTYVTCFLPTTKQRVNIRWKNNINHFKKVLWQLAVLSLNKVLQASQTLKIRAY